MGIQDRRYNTGDYGEGGGFNRAMRRIFVDGDDFYSWSVPLFSVPKGTPLIGGIAVRVHLFYVLFIVIELLRSIPQTTMGIGYSAAAMATLFVIVLLHEFGHCIACRQVGGEAERILMWPLGGLAYCIPPHNWKAAFITTAGGPLVNVLLVPILGGALLASGAPTDALWYNPFVPSRVLGDSWFDAYAKVWLWWAYYMNWALLAFNVCVIMFPLDGGRMFQEIMWKFRGYRSSMSIALNVGLVVAVLLGAYAITSGQGMLIGIAIFGGLTCFMERRRLAMTQGDFDWEAPARGGVASSWKPSDDKAYKAAAKKQEKERATQAEVDRILDKIRQQGMGSLSRKEKAVLSDATEKQQGKSR